MYSKDFKKLSLNQLSGKWAQVIGAMLCAVLITAVVSMLYNVSSVAFDFWAAHTSGFFSFILCSVSAVISIVVMILTIVVSGCIQYGSANYTLHLVRYGETNISYIFSGFSYGLNTIKRCTILAVLTALFTFLWSCLFLIPGIVAAFSYSMAFYILADNDNITAYDALKLSKEMMRGHKWKLFCLFFSFIGWMILCALTFGIGTIFLEPYLETSKTNFYEYVRGVYDQKNVFSA